MQQCVVQVRALASSIKRPQESAVPNNGIHPAAPVQTLALCGERLSITRKSGVVAVIQVTPSSAVGGSGSECQRRTASTAPIAFSLSWLWSLVIPDMLTRINQIISCLNANYSRISSRLAAWRNRARMHSILEAAVEKASRQIARKGHR